MVTILGASVPVQRINTGLYSFDHAFINREGDIGFPVGKGVEVYGQTFCIDADTHIDYKISNQDGKKQNSKGGTVKRLYERFHKLPRKGQGNYQRKQTINSFFSITSINENDEITNNLIVDVINMGVQPCYKLTTETGKSLICTEEHKFYIGNGKYVQLSKLTINDVVYIHNNTYKPTIKIGRKSYKEVSVKYHPGWSKHTVNGCLYYRNHKSIAVIEADMNSMEYSEFIKLLNTQSKEEIDDLKFLGLFDVVHHKDRNYRNDAISNLLVLPSKSEHHRLHSDEFAEFVKRIVVPDTIKSIEYVGERETFDIMCSYPNNNFIANRIVVHNCGKSTITYGLAGIVAKSIGKDIALADFEGFDPKFLETVLATSGFDSNIYCIQEEDDEDALDKLLSSLREKKYGVGILDSIGAISPVSEAEGELGEANMGRRAFLMAQFSRKALKIMRSDDSKTIFMINHAYPKIGGRGLDTPGGEVKKYLASIRIAIKRKYIKGKYEEFPDGSYIIEGTVVKNRWGLKDKVFNLFVLSGKGIHLGLTAMYDAINLGLVTRGKTIKIDERSFGTMKEVVRQAHDGNDDFFNPFIEIVKYPDVVKNLEDVEMKIEEIDNEDNSTDEEGL